MTNKTKKLMTRLLCLALCAAMMIGLFFGVGPFKGIAPQAEAAGTTYYTYSLCEKDTIPTGQYLVLCRKTSTTYYLMRKENASTSGYIACRSYGDSGLPLTIRLNQEQADGYEWYITKNSSGGSMVQLRNTSADTTTGLQMMNADGDLFYGARTSGYAWTWTYSRDGSLYALSATVNSATRYLGFSDGRYIHGWPESSLYNSTGYNVALYELTSTDTSYPISCSTTGGGVVNAKNSSGENNRAYAGDTVTVTITPNDGFWLKTLTITDTTNGVTITPTILTYGERYSFTMPAGDVTVNATFGNKTIVEINGDAQVSVVTAYNPIYGTFRKCATFYAAYGSQLTLHAELDPARPDYEFDYWEIYDSTGHNAVSNNADTTITVGYPIQTGYYEGEVLVNANARQKDAGGIRVYENGRITTPTLAEGNYVGGSYTLTTYYPVPAACTFLGWTTSPVSETSTAPTYVTGLTDDTITDATETYYALYSYMVGITKYATDVYSNIYYYTQLGNAYGWNFYNFDRFRVSQENTLRSIAYNDLPAANTVYYRNGDSLETYTFSGWTKDNTVIYTPTTKQPATYYAKGTSFIPGADVKYDLYAVYYNASTGKYLTAESFHVTASTSGDGFGTVSLKQRSQMFNTSTAYYFSSGTTRLKSGDLITVDISPASGSCFASITVKNARTNEVYEVGDEVTEVSAGSQYTFTLPTDDVIVTVAFGLPHDLSFIVNGEELASLADAVPTGVTTTLPTVAQVSAAGGDTTVDRYDPAAAATETYTLVGWSADEIAVPTATQPADLVAAGGSYTGGSADAALHAVYSATIDGTTYYLTEGGHDVNLPTVAHAAVSAGPNGGSDVGVGESFTVTVTPDAGYGLSGDITVTDGNGTPLVPTDVSQSGDTLVYTYTMPASDVNVSVPIVEEHALGFVVNGEELASLADAVPEGGTATLPTVAQVSAAGGDTTVDRYDPAAAATETYTLVGWSADEIAVPTATQPADLVAAGGSYTGGSADAALHAVYSATIDGTTYYLTEGGHDVNLPTVAHAAVSAGPNGGSDIGVGESFTVTVTPESGYGLSGDITVTDGNGTPLVPTDVSQSGDTLVYTYTMPASDVNVSVPIVEEHALGFVVNGEELASLADAVYAGGTTTLPTVAQVNAAGGDTTVDRYDPAAAATETFTLIGWSADEIAVPTPTQPADLVAAGGSYTGGGADAALHAVYSATIDGTTYYLTEGGHEVNLPKEEHAAVSAGPNGGSDVGVGESFTVTVTPDAGYGLSGDITVTDGNGTPLVPTDVSQSGDTLVYTYTMPASDVNVSVPIVIAAQLDDELVCDTIAFSVEGVLKTQFAIFDWLHPTRDYESYYITIMHYMEDGTEDPSGQLTMNVYELAVGYNLRVAFYDVYATYMADRLDVTVFAVKNGVTYHGPTQTMSIRSIAADTLTDPTNSPAKKTTYADMLAYGAQAQLRFGYNTNDLANALTGEALENYNSAVTTAEPEFVTIDSIVSTPDNMGQEKVTLWRRALSVEERVYMQFGLYFGSYDVNDFTVRVTIGDRVEAVTDENLVLLDPSYPGYYVLKVMTIDAVEGQTPVSVTVYEGDTPVSRTYTDTIENLASTKTGEDAPLASRLVRFYRSVYNLIYPY